MIKTLQATMRTLFDVPNKKVDSVIIEVKHLGESLDEIKKDVSNLKDGLNKMDAKLDRLLERSSSK